MTLLRTAGGRCSWFSSGTVGQVGERQRAVGAGAAGQAVAARADDLSQRGPDGGQVGDLRLDFGDLGLGAVAQVRGGVAAAAGVEEFGHLLEGEAEPLGGFDDGTWVPDASPSRGRTKGYEDPLC